MQKECQAPFKNLFAYRFGTLFLKTVLRWHEFRPWKINANRHLIGVAAVNKYHIVEKYDCMIKNIISFTAITGYGSQHQT